MAPGTPVRINAADILKLRNRLAAKDTIHSGLSISNQATQGSHLAVATLGFVTQSLRDCRVVSGFYGALHWTM
jgi:hypothetical protein